MIGDITLQKLSSSSSVCMSQYVIRCKLPRSVKSDDCILCFGSWTAWLVLNAVNKKGSFLVAASDPVLT